MLGCRAFALFGAVILTLDVCKSVGNLDILLLKTLKSYFNLRHITIMCNMTPKKLSFLSTLDTTVNVRTSLIGKNVESISDLVICYDNNTTVRGFARSSKSTTIILFKINNQKDIESIFVPSINERVFFLNQDSLTVFESYLQNGVRKRQDILRLERTASLSYNAHEIQTRNFLDRRMDFCGRVLKAVIDEQVLSSLL